MYQIFLLFSPLSCESFKFYYIRVDNFLASPSPPPVFHSLTFHFLVSHIWSLFLFYHCPWLCDQGMTSWVGPIVSLSLSVSVSVCLTSPPVPPPSLTSYPCESLVCNAHALEPPRNLLCAGTVSSAVTRWESRMFLSDLSHTCFRGPKIYLIIKISYWSKCLILASEAQRSIWLSKCLILASEALRSTWLSKYLIDQNVLYLLQRP